MNAASFALVLTGVLLNAGAQLLLKAGTNAFPTLGLDRHSLLLSGLRIATEPHIVGGLACYVLSVAIWIAALSRVPVSIAYPMLSIGYVVNALAAWMLFGESLSAQKLVGIGVIIVGVFLVARS
jgi:multidrug transporter EmrE-like cation transporter